MQNLRDHLLAGHVIPAHPLALRSDRSLDEKRQRALTRYYLASGAGGIAVGVHTTQFGIRDKGLYQPVLEIAADASAAASAAGTVARIAGVCGRTSQALREVNTALAAGYDAALLSLAAWQGEADTTVLDHCRVVSEAIPIFGFYLQPAAGGRVLGYRFWRRFVEIPNLVAVKIAPFNRYATLDVVRALAESDREDVALYTGNDDNIVLDLLTPFTFRVGGSNITRRMVGGLLGHWAVWTRSAVQMLEGIKIECSRLRIDPTWLQCAAEVTDANSALFDAANGYRGCIPGIHEILRRQGLLEGTWCLDPDERLSPGQAEELTRVTQAYPWMDDSSFVHEHLDEWMA
jgi:dihydrodipicolinate synthase/N-acetylneuraminate lyase